MGATFSTLPINLQRRRVATERFVGEWYRFNSRESRESKNDISELESINFCYDAQNKLHQNPTGCHSYSEAKAGKNMVDFLGPKSHEFYLMSLRFGYQFSCISTVALNRTAALFQHCIVTQCCDRRGRYFTQVNNGAEQPFDASANI